MYLKLEAKDKANTLMPALKNKVASLGDCDLLALRGEQIHIHVHTNEPVSLFKALAVLGKISRPKVEDMLRQYQAFHSQKSIALVTDASADIDERILEQNQIHLIPLPMTFDGHEALDPYTVDKTTFYSQLEHFEQPPKTASPNLEKVRSLLTHLSTHYKKVLVITISSKMSATYQSLSQLAQSMREVSVFDSLTNSGAHGFVVTKAAELIDKKYDLEHIVEQLTHYRQKVSMLVAINSVSAILASGRVSGLKGELLKRVNPKLIISINKSGKGIIYKKFFLKKDIFNELLNIVTQKYRKKAFKRYCVLYVSDKQQAESFANKLSQLIGVKPSFISCASSAVGIHAGKEGLAVAYEQG